MFLQRLSCAGRSPGWGSQVRSNCLNYRPPHTMASRGPSAAELETSTEEYIESSGVGALMEDLLKAVVEAKPDDAVAFLLTRLRACLPCPASRK